MKDGNIGETLLKKQYYENCPGCKVDKAKELKTDVSFRNLLNIWMVVLCSCKLCIEINFHFVKNHDYIVLLIYFHFVKESLMSLYLCFTALPISSLFPYQYFMIRDFNIAEREEDISAYAGYMGSAYMLGRSLTSILWGVIADRYGRKPVAILGVISVIIFNTLFGLSTSFWMAVTTRFFLGSLNGLLGPMKAYCSEIFREEKQAFGLSTLSAAWGIGLIIGPALGGYLAQPTIKYPNLFPKDSFWDKFPYFLPSISISAFAFAVAIACIWLPETLHNHPLSNESIDGAEALETGRNGKAGKDKIIQKDENLFLNWPLMSSIVVYCIFSLYNISYQEVFSLWAVSSRRLGGLNFTTGNVGDVLAISGTSLICVLSIPLLQSYPFIAMLSGITLYLVINIASLLKNLLSEQHQRGAANGIAMTGMSIFKTIGPAGGGAVLAWSQKRMNASFLPGMMFN
ncbi:putative major facilitator superfamily [Medicago truncatula]|uniref:Putative major facilitator superfamily n=1 Tax=Medicago truncatula TaxID=3880 RepID=A0A396GL77_MEDTR|nr:putative major facilitator superfamily [Medicago truncatula]